MKIIKTLKTILVKWDSLPKEYKRLVYLLCRKIVLRYKQDLLLEEVNQGEK